LSYGTPVTEELRQRGETVHVRGDKTI